MEAAAGSGSRHVAVASAAALFRLAVENANDVAEDLLIEDELKARLSSVEPVLRKQLQASLDSFGPCRDGRAVASPDEMLRRNIAVHKFNTVQVGPFS